VSCGFLDKYIIKTYYTYQICQKTYTDRKFGIFQTWVVEALVLNDFFFGSNLRITSFQNSFLCLDIIILSIEGTTPNY